MLPSASPSLGCLALRSQHVHTHALALTHATLRLSSPPPTGVLAITLGSCYLSARELLATAYRLSLWLCTLQPPRGAARQRSRKHTDTHTTRAHSPARAVSLTFSRSSPEDFALSGDRGVSICTRTVSVTAPLWSHAPRPTPLSARSLGSGCALCLCLRVLTYVRRLWVAETSSETHSPYLHFYVYSIKVKGREIYMYTGTPHGRRASLETRQGRQVARPNKPKAAILSLCLAHRSSAPAL